MKIPDVRLQEVQVAAWAYVDSQQRLAVAEETLAQALAQAKLDIERLSDLHAETRKTLADFFAPASPTDYVLQAFAQTLVDCTRARIGGE